MPLGGLGPGPSVQSTLPPPVALPSLHRGSADPNPGVTEETLPSELGGDV